MVVERMYAEVVAPVTSRIGIIYKVIEITIWTKFLQPFIRDESSKGGGENEAMEEGE